MTTWSLSRQMDRDSRGLCDRPDGITLGVSREPRLIGRRG